MYEGFLKGIPRGPPAWLGGSGAASGNACAAGPHLDGPRCNNGTGKNMVKISGGLP